MPSEQSRRRRRCPRPGALVSWAWVAATAAVGAVGASVLADSAFVGTVDGRASSPRRLIGTAVSLRHASSSSSESESEQSEGPISSSPQHHRRQSRRDVLQRAAAHCAGTLSIAAAVATSANPAPVAAATNSKKTVADIYDSASSSYDSLYSGSRTAAALDFDGLRKATLAPATGRVLELGVGTGLNLPHYPSNGNVKSVVGVDVSKGMLARAEKRVGLLPSGITAEEFKAADASDLPFEDGTFDAVVDTFSLCVFEDPKAVLAEARRVLKPGGVLLLTETDGTAASKLLGWTNNFLSSDVARTCRANDDVLGLIRGAGFDVVETEVVGGGVFRRVVARRALSRIYMMV